MAKTKIKSFQQACIKLGYDVVKCLPKVTGMPKQHRNAIIAHAKLIIITEALNDGWVPDWRNSSEYKYYPWFDMSSGSGLSYGDFDSWLSASHVGSRLCFKSRELAEYAGKQFIDLYKDYFLMS